MSSKRTSQQWWNEIKADDAAFIGWLKDQFHGELTAYDRIKRFCVRYGSEHPNWTNTLRVIADQERIHASWIADLLTTRGIVPSILQKDARYWDVTLPSVTSFESGAAVAAHAEQMRLERISVIAGDETAPVDVRDVFTRILPDGRFHARAFATMAGDAALAAAFSKHEAGMDAIGLIPGTL